MEIAFKLYKCASANKTMQKLSLMTIIKYNNNCCFAGTTSYKVDVNSTVFVGLNVNPFFVSSFLQLNISKQNSGCFPIRLISVFYKSTKIIKEYQYERK